MLSAQLGSSVQQLLPLVSFPFADLMQLLQICASVVVYHTHFHAYLSQQVFRASITLDVLPLCCACVVCWQCLATRGAAEICISTADARAHTHITHSMFATISIIDAAAMNTHPCLASMSSVYAVLSSVRLNMLLLLYAALSNTTCCCCQSSRQAIKRPHVQSLRRELWHCSCCQSGHCSGWSSLKACSSCCPW